MNAYLSVTRDVYREAALNPQQGLCCATSPVWRLPELTIPSRMLEMNYGCGSTVNPRDLVNDPSILYVGVGGGMEVLQFAYFNRRKGGVIGLDIVDEMLTACHDNLEEAEAENPWFRRDFVDLRKGDALNLPIADETIDVAAQNCLFNIFHDDDLEQALFEMHRVLKPHGKLILSDPVCETIMPSNLKQDQRLRALCLTGALPLADYIERLTNIGFGTIEVRAKRPYRVLSPRHYPTERLIKIESVEIAAIKDPMPADGPCVFTGKAAIYYGDDDFFDDRKGHVLSQNQPMAICDKTAAALKSLGRDDIFVSEFDLVLRWRRMLLSAVRRKRMLMSMHMDEDFCLRQLSIIVPVLNEESTILDFLGRLAPLRDKGAEVILVDGGSVDRTMERADLLADRVLVAPRGRGSQMNAGAAEARRALLLFLHADTELPANVGKELGSFLADQQRVWGRFDVRITGGHWLFPVIASMMNMRSCLTGIATGDQAMFVRKAAFETVGGFPDIPLMEDIELSRKLIRLSRPVCIRSKVTTSGRRWEKGGLMKTIILMWRLRFAYWRGDKPAELAKRYGYAPRAE